MPPSSETFSVRIPQEMRDELDQLATTMDRPRNWLVVEALKEYLEVQRWQVELIRQRVEEAQREGATFIPHEEVMRRHEERLKAKLGL